MKRIALRTWRNAAYLLLILAAIVLVALWWPDLVRIWREQALTFVGAVAVMICGTLVQAANFLAFLEVRHSLRVWRFSRIWALSALANYVAPLQPGIAVRVGWLAKRGIGIAEGLLATWRQLVASLWISLIGLSIGLLLSGDLRGRWSAILLALAWIAAFVLRRLWLTILDRLNWPAWLASRKQLLQRAARGITLRGILGVTIQYALGTIVLYWVYNRFGAHIGVGQAVILACLVYASSMIALLPGNLGVTEAIYMLGGHGFGLSVAEAGALAILLRVSNITSNALLILVGTLIPREPSEPRVNTSR
jgi:uncharacterized membrane protein YbhN (UPF0104 family)